MLVLVIDKNPEAYSGYVELTERIHGAKARPVGVKAKPWGERPVIYATDADSLISYLFQCRFAAPSKYAPYWYQDLEQTIFVIQSDAKALTTLLNAGVPFVHVLLAPINVASDYDSRTLTIAHFKSIRGLPDLTRTIARDVIPSEHYWRIALNRLSIWTNDLLKQIMGQCNSPLKSLITEMEDKGDTLDDLECVVGSKTWWHSHSRMHMFEAREDMSPHKFAAFTKNWVYIPGYDDINGCGVVGIPRNPSVTDGVFIDVTETGLLTERKHHVS